MKWWMILLVVLGGLGIVFGLYVLGRRLVWFVRSFIVGLFSELANGSLSGTEAAQPRSLSSLESLLLPQVRRDFPEYNSALAAERVKRDAKAYYQSGVNGSPAFTDEATKPFLTSFAAALPTDVKGDIRVHRVALHAYDASGDDRMLTYQASVQYLDTTDVIRQKRLVLQYIASFTDDPASEMKSFNCPNCGAPLPTIGRKTCRYCGTALKVPAGFGWRLYSAREG